MGVYVSVWKQTLLMEEEEEEEAINKPKARRRSSSSLKKIRRRSSSSARGNGIERRINTLRSLVPNTNNHGDCAVGLEQLFSQTADYILSLQTRVRLMQTLVDALSGSSNSDE